MPCALKQDAPKTQRNKTTSLVQQAMSHAELLKILEIPSLNVIHFDAILRRMVALQKGQPINAQGPKVTNALSYCCNRIIMDQESELRQVVGVLWASAKLKYNEIYMSFGIIEDRIIELRHQMNDQAVSNVLFACSTLNARPSPKLLHCLWEFLRSHADKFTAQAAVNTLQALSRMGLRREFTEAAGILEPFFPGFAERKELTTPATSSLFGAFASIKVPPGPGMMDALMASCRALASDFDAQAVATTFISLARLGHRDKVEECARLLEEPLTRLPLALVQTNNILLSYAKLELDPSPEVFDALCVSILRHVEGSSPHPKLLEEAVHALGALADLGRLPRADLPLVDALVGLIVPRVTSMDRATVIEVTNHLARLTAVHPDLIKSPRVTSLLKTVSASLADSNLLSPASSHGHALTHKKLLASLADSALLFAVAALEAPPSTAPAPEPSTPAPSLPPEDPGLHASTTTPGTRIPTVLPVGSVVGGSSGTSSTGPSVSASSGSGAFQLGALEVPALREMMAEGRAHFARESSAHRLARAFESAWRQKPASSSESDDTTKPIKPAESSLNALMLNVPGCLTAVVGDLYFSETNVAVLLMPGSFYAHNSGRPLGAFRVREALARGAGWRVATLREDLLAQCESDTDRIRLVLKAVEGARPHLEGTPLSLPDLPAPQEFESIASVSMGVARALELRFNSNSGSRDAGSGTGGTVAGSSGPGSGVSSSSTFASSSSDVSEVPGGLALGLSRTGSGDLARGKRQPIGPQGNRGNLPLGPAGLLSAAPLGGRPSGSQANTRLAMASGGSTNPPYRTAQGPSVRPSPTDRSSAPIPQAAAYGHAPYGVGGYGAYPPPGPSAFAPMYVPPYMVPPGVGAPDPGPYFPHQAPHGHLQQGRPLRLSAPTPTGALPPFPLGGPESSYYGAGPSVPAAAQPSAFPVGPHLLQTSHSANPLAQGSPPTYPQDPGDFARAQNVAQMLAMTQGPGPAAEQQFMAHMGQGGYGMQMAPPGASAPGPFFLDPSASLQYGYYGFPTPAAGFPVQMPMHPHPAVTAAAGLASQMSPVQSLEAETQAAQAQADFNMLLMQQLTLNPQGGNRFQ